MKVTNLRSSRGNKVPNQYSIETGNSIIFQSYDSIIAEVTKGIIYLDPVYYNYSKTTSKYLYMFINMSKKEIQEGLRSGKIQFKNLN
jgi:hypothetical protein